jgi:uncharacterized protein (TIGR02466 family)
MKSEVLMMFPVTISYSQDVLEESYKNDLFELTKKIKETTFSGGHNWETKTYNTLNTLNLETIKEFSKLSEIVKRKVNELNNVHGSDYEYTCQYSWFNFYEIGDYQEFHNHPSSTWSAVYFLKSNSNCSPLIFENPLMNFDMLPIKNIKVYNEHSFNTIKFSPIENSLIIFRSYVKHMVPKKILPDNRITVAYNF